MTMWDFLSSMRDYFPLFLGTPVVVALVIIAVIGFCKRGVVFFRYGFGELPVIPSDVATKKDIEMMSTSIEMLSTQTKKDFEMLSIQTKKDIEMLSISTKKDIESIKTNHFEHLTNFLDLLCSILKDKNILTDTECTMLKHTLKD
ncbi:MAG: hypothetical protein Ta2G_07720 [Termitinemataceae bacterium]|nr:MAG: hypothetical protein Ta2G_07720 [Termitinemataceae bacterium]